MVPKRVAGFESLPSLWSAGSVAAVRPAQDSLSLAGFLRSFAHTLSRKTLRGPLLGCRHRCFLSAGRSLLWRHCLKTPLAADLAALTAQLVHYLRRQVSCSAW